MACERGRKPAPTNASECLRDTPKRSAAVVWRTFWFTNPDPRHPRCPAGLGPLTREPWGSPIFPGTGGALKTVVSSRLAVGGPWGRSLRAVLNKKKNLVPLAAVGGWRLAVGGWRLVAVGGGWWRLVAVGGGWWSLGAVLKGGP